MRKIFWLTIILLCAILLALWSPWRSWNISIATFFGITPPEAVSGLQVSSLAGELVVTIDGEEQGRVTPETSPLLVIDVDPGEHQLQLVRHSTIDGAFVTLNKVINFHPGIDTVMAYELGPTLEFSAGHVISTSPRTGATDDNVLLNISSNAANTSVFIDNIKVGELPIADYVVNTTEQHRIRLESPGYERQEFVLLPDSADDRAKLKGLTLNVAVDLFLQPIPVRDI